MTHLSYLGTPYTHLDPVIQRMRHRNVTRCAYNLLVKGTLVYSPITHNIPIDALGFHGNWRDWSTFDHAMLSRCDRLLVLQQPGWEESKGLAAEMDLAKQLNKPIEFLSLEESLTIPNPANEAPQAIEELLHTMDAFYHERDWAQFHAPKNLALSLASEVGELVEHFRWVSDDESHTLETDQRDAVSDEIGDVLLVLLNLANKLGIDPLSAAARKLKKIGERYPADQSRGKCLKYTAYEG